MNVAGLLATQPQRLLDVLFAEPRSDEMAVLFRIERDGAPLFVGVRLA